MRNQESRKRPFPAYYPPYGQWEHRQPEIMGVDTSLLNRAVTFAIENEIDYPKNLRIPILQTYGREPGFRIMGPVIDRGGPAGVVVLKGYIIASWGDIETGSHLQCHQKLSVNHSRTCLG